MQLSKSFDKKKAIDIFRESLQANKLSRAYLFTGEAESDKKDVAIKLAQMVNCKQSLLKNCQCSKCKRIKSLQHPDILWYSPEGESSSIKIKQIRDLRKKISLKPYELNRKVFIIYEAEKMTEEAQNALLKTLEETPADSLLILISRSTSGLLDTIISRCNILKFRKKSHLEDTLTRSGIIDKFLSYREKQIENLLENKNREEVQFIVKTLLGVYRDILFLKLDAEDSILLNPEKKEVFVNLLQSYTLKQLHQAIEILADTAEKIDCNINLKNCVMNILIALKQIKGQEVI